MSQLTLIALIGIAGWLAWRRYVEARTKLEKRLRENELAKAKGMALERDPKTGVYRPPAARR